MPASPGISIFGTATSWALSPPRPTGVSNTSARSHTSSPGGPPSTCCGSIDALSTHFVCSPHQLPSLATAESFAGVPTKEGNTRAKRSSSVAWNRASPRSLRPPTRLSKTTYPSALARPFALWFAAFSSTVDSPFAATNTPQQNGMSERVGQALCSMVRCLLVDSGLPPKLWGELVLTAPYLCNRMPHSGLDMETPFKRLNGKKANLSHLKIIGARAFVHIKDAKKLEPKSWEGML